MTTEPDRQALRIFALTAGAFFACLGVLAALAPEVLLGASIFTGVAAAFSLLFNRDEPLSAQLWGLAIPAALFGMAIVERTGIPGEIAAAAGVLFGAGCCIFVLVKESAGRQVYRAWIRAGMPIGWSVSFWVLLVVYFGIVTPMGVALRLGGQDPLRRKLERSAKTYWEEHDPGDAGPRYFRQF